MRTTIVSSGGSTTPSPRRTARRKPPLRIPARFLSARCFPARVFASEVDSESAMGSRLSVGGRVSSASLARKIGGVYFLRYDHAEVRNDLN